MTSTLIPETLVGETRSARSVPARLVVLRRVGGWDTWMTERWVWEHTTAMAVPSGVRVV